MSTLNSEETDSLRSVLAILDALGNQNMTEEQRKQLAKTAYDKVKTVVAMKGYYPK